MKIDAAEDVTVTRMTTTWGIIRHGGILNGTQATNLKPPLPNKCGSSASSKDEYLLPRKW